jgi:hypothetical protein
MPGSVPRLSPGSAGADLPAEIEILQRMSDLSVYTASVWEIFAIEIEVVLPGRLSRLLGVLHLFVRFGMVTFQYVTQRCLRSQVILSSHFWQIRSLLHK